MVDGIDIEFCWRAKEMRLMTYKVPAGHLNQQYGNVQHKKLFGLFNYSVYNYNPSRLKGTVESLIQIMRHYPLPKSEMYGILKYFLIKLPVIILLGEKQKIAKLKAIVVGLCHALTKKINFSNRLREECRIF